MINHCIRTWISWWLPWMRTEKNNRSELSEESSPPSLMNLLFAILTTAFRQCFTVGKKIGKWLIEKRGRPNHILERHLGSSTLLTLIQISPRPSRSLTLVFAGMPYTRYSVIRFRIRLRGDRWSFRICVIGIPIPFPFAQEQHIGKRQTTSCC